MIVSSFGSLQTLEAGGPAVPSLSLLNNVSSQAPGVWVADGDHYAMLYRTQPTVRTCVDFLARNMAQLGLHVFRRISDTDRERLADHQLAQWLAKPNPGTTRYKLFEALMQDLGIYWRAYWLKIRRTDGELGLVRLPPASVAIDGWLLPNVFVWTLPNGQVIELDPSQVAYFSGYDPEDLNPLSPLETLSQRLAEEQAATAFRARYWANAARLEGVVERPLNAPKWTKDQKDSWRDQWRARYDDHPGQTAVLEDGMTWKSVPGRRRCRVLHRAQVDARRGGGRVSHPAADGRHSRARDVFATSTSSTSSSIKTASGPGASMIVEEIERELLSECRDQDRRLSRVQHRREAEGLVRRAGHCAAAAGRAPDHDGERRPRAS